MTRIIKFEMEVTDEEFANFLHRSSGADGRKVTVTTDDSDEGPANTAAPATDKNGVAWDARFHASSKAIVADGSWRRKKGLTDAEKAAADEYDKIATEDVVVESPTGETVTIPMPVEPTMPGLPEPAAVPGLPTPAPVEVSYADLLELFKNPDVVANYAKYYADAGVTDPNALKTDGTLRARLAEVIRAATAG